MWFCFLYTELLNIGGACLSVGAMVLLWATDETVFYKIAILCFSIQMLDLQFLFIWNKSFRTVVLNLLAPQARVAWAWGWSRGWIQCRAGVQGWSVGVTWHINLAWHAGSSCRAAICASVIWCMGPYHLACSAPHGCSYLAGGGAVVVLIAMSLETTGWITWLCWLEMEHHWFKTKMFGCSVCVKLIIGQTCH